MAPPPKPERYNAKARGSVAGGSTHKKRKRPKANRPPEREDGHSGEEDQRERLPMEGEGRGAMSAKRRKRLDSYVTKKLKSEQRLSTLKLLASLAPSTDTSQNLLSTSTLGQNPLRPSSAKERAEKREDRVVRRGIDLLKQRGAAAAGENGDSGSSSEDEQNQAEQRGGKSKGKQRERERIVDVTMEGEEVEEGGEGGDGVKVSVVKGKKEKRAEEREKIQGNKGRMPRKADWNPHLLSTQPPSSDSSDFDSSDSDYDSPVEQTTLPANVLASKSEEPLGLTVEGVEKHVEPVAARPRVVASALKKAEDGSVVQPRVVTRRPKMPLGRRRRVEVQEESDEEGESSGSGGSGVTGEVENDSEDDDVEDDEEEDGDESGDEDPSDAEEPDLTPPPKKRALGFKSWALSQMGQVTSAQTPDLTVSNPSLPAAARPKADIKTDPDLSTTAKQERAPHIGPLGATLAIPSSSLLDQGFSSASTAARPVVKRRQSVSEARMELPILAEEQAIVEAVRMHPAVIIAGETGSGKTTQVPQMLYEAGFGFPGSDNPGMIGITQPRRVAALSLAHRVAAELCLPPSSRLVAHQIRYSRTTSPETAIKFMTDGVLLRELSSDFLLSRYSVIVVDEAHERGVNTDVLIGVLSRVAKLREKKWRDSLSTSTNSDDVKPDNTIKPLRIIIMSATLRIADFAQNPSLFPTPPPIIHIPARQHPVTVHFARRTTGDYVDEAYRKVCKIHARLPVGGVLVFVTGEGEVRALVRRLTKKFGAGNLGEKAEDSRSASRSQQGRARRIDGGKEYDAEAEPDRGDEMEVPPEDQEAEEVELGAQDEDLAADVDDGDAAVLDPEGLDTDDEDIDQELGIDEPSDKPMHILPLYSLLPSSAQLAVFKPPPVDHRLVIISTNIAETSLTIPGIRYVVDCGRAKTRTYDPSTGVQSFSVQWISKASASQRAGRAGRTGPGHCWRLYSSALYEDHMPEFGEPEILRMPIEGVVLQMKSMGIDNVVNFPFPTPPDRGSLAKAEKLLVSLGAVEGESAGGRLVHGRWVEGEVRKGDGGGRVTDIGRLMAGYPVAPRFGKMLVLGRGAQDQGTMGLVIALVAGLSGGDPFIHEQSLELGGDDERESADGEEHDEDTRRGGRRREIEGIRSEGLREKEERKDVRRSYFKAQSQFEALGHGQSDAFKLLAAIGAYEYEPTGEFCQRSFLRQKAMQEIQQLRRQIAHIAKVPLTMLAPPSDTQLKILRQILCAAFIDNLSVRLDLYLKHPQKFASCRSVPFRIPGLASTNPSDGVFVHPSSSLFHKPPPDFLVYHEVTTSASAHGTPQRWLKGVTKVNPAWIWKLGKGECSLSKPQEVPAGKGKAVGGGAVERIREGEREVVLVPHHRGLGVDLPGVRMKQRREGTRWVLVDE